MLLVLLSGVIIFGNPDATFKSVSAQTVAQSHISDRDSCELLEKGLSWAWCYKDCNCSVTLDTPEGEVGGSHTLDQPWKLSKTSQNKIFLVILHTAHFTDMLPLSNHCMTFTQVNLLPYGGRCTGNAQKWMLVRIFVYHSDPKSHRPSSVLRDSHIRRGMPSL